MHSTFWSSLVSLIGAATDSDRVSLVRAVGSGHWTVQLLSGGHGEPVPDAVARQLEVLMPGGTVELPDPSGEGTCLLGRFAGSAQSPGVWIRLEADVPVDGRDRLEMLLALPGWQADSEILKRTGGNAEHLTAVLDLVVILNRARRFRETAISLVNELEVRLGCDRVSLGWIENGDARVVAVSHSDAVDSRSEVVAGIARAMEECADQDCEVFVPPPENTLAVSREHEQFAASAGGARNVMSLPLRGGDEVCGVLLVERGDRTLAGPEAVMLRLVADLCAPVLERLRETDQWLGARWVRGCGKAAEGLLGHKHTGWKLAGIAAVVVGLVLGLGRMEYRVEAPFILKAESSVELSAPFDGFIEDVRYHVGDAVTEGQVLLTFETRDLLLEESERAAEVLRFRATAKKAEAESDLPQMGIAAASAEEAEAKLEIVRYRLARAEVRAPFAGVIVEGDLRERLGAPMRQGEALVKVAKLEGLVAELDVDERDIHELDVDDVGELAFASRPEHKIPFRVERLESAARSTKDGNVFSARGVPEGAGEGWWRPGLSGVAKIEAGRRTFWWVLTHRTIDYLRLRLWL